MGCSSSSSNTNNNHKSSSLSGSSRTLAGYLLKRSSKDSHVWKRHYCVLTEDDLWYVPRIVRSNETEPQCGRPLSEKGGGGNNNNNNNTIVRTIELARYHGRIPLVDALLLDNQKTGHRKDGFDLVDGNGTTHEFRSCSSSNSSSSSATASSNSKSNRSTSNYGASATTTTASTISASHTASASASASILSQARHWRRMIAIQCQDAFENALIQHAELILTEETFARTERWKQSILGAGKNYGSGNGSGNGETVHKNLSSSSSSSPSLLVLLRSRILHFGLDVAEYKEGCRQIQALLLSSPTTITARTKRLLRELWTEAFALLETAIEIQHHNKQYYHCNAIADADAGIAGVDAASGSNDSAMMATTRSNSSGSSCLETLCDHVEYVITQTRRRRKPSRTTSTSTSTSTSTTIHPSKASNSKSSISSKDRTIVPEEDENNRNNNDNHSNGDESVDNKNRFRAAGGGSGNRNRNRNRDYPHHQRDPPPIDLFDLLWNELRTLG